MARRSTAASVLGFTAALLLALAMTASAATSTTDGETLAKILANTEQIKAKLGIPATPPRTTPPQPPSPTTTTARPSPSGSDGVTAAARLGWGTPLPQSDEFNYVGAPDPTKWGVYDSAGHNGNGRRVPGANRVGQGILRQTGLANGDTGGMASLLNQRGGKWEVRARVTGSGPGRPYHAVLLTWPQSERWPQGGEYDFFEVNVGDTEATAFMHHPADTVIQDQFRSRTLDLGSWHNYGFAWDAAGKTLTGYIDGVEWFNVTDPSAQAPGPMHGTVQLDAFSSGPMQQAFFDLDWYRIYK